MEPSLAGGFVRGEILCRIGCMKNATFAEKALSFLAIFTLFATPLALFSGRLYPFVGSKSFFFMGFAELTFFLWIYLASTNSAYRLSKKQIIVFLVPLALLVSLTISAIWAPIPNLAFWGSFERASGLIFLVHCVVFGVGIASLIKVQGKEFLNRFYRTIFYSGIIIALATFINEHFINIPALFLFDGPNSADLFGNSSFSGGYLIFSAFIGAILLFQNWNSKNRFWQILGLAVILLSPIMDKARGATLGIFAGILVAFAVWLTTNSKKFIRAIGISILGLVLVSGVAVGASLVKEGSKIHNAFIEATTNSRFIFWGASVEGIKERPVFGWGQENYIVLFGKHFDPSILEPGSTSETWTDKPHNSFLEMFVSGGFVGGILYLLFALALFGLPIYLYRRKVFDRTSLALFEGMFFAYFLQALILFDTIPSLMMLFALFGLLVGSVVFQNSDGKKLSGDTTKSVMALFCIALFIFSWINFVHQPLRKSKAIITSMSNSTGRQEKFAKLVTMSPMGNGGDIAYLASVMSMAYSKNMTEIKRDPARVQMTHEEIQKFLDTVDSLDEVAKNSGRLWLVAAELVNMDVAIIGKTTEEDFNRVIGYLDRAKELIPNNPRLYWVYGQAYLNVDDYKKAYEAYKKAYEINPKVEKSKNYLEKFEEVFGDKIR